MAHTMEYHSVIKKKKDDAFCSNKNATIDHTSWNKSERERQIPCGITYMWNPKYDTNGPIHETETDSQTQGQTCQGGGDWDRDGLGGWC